MMSYARKKNGTVPFGTTNPHGLTTVGIRRFIWIYCKDGRTMYTKWTFVR